MSSKEIKVILTGFSIILFVSLYYNISKSTVESTTAIIQAVTSILTLIVTIVTIYFLYKNYNQQQIHIDKTNEDVEFNRILDTVYRQLDLSLPLIKNKDYSVFNKIIIDVESKREDIIHTIEQFELEIYDLLGNIEKHIELFLIIINNPKLSVEDREYLRILISTNLDNDFFNFLLTLKGFSKDIFNGENTYAKIINRILIINKKIK